MSSNIPDSTEVVVIGGGPAGAMAATYLAQSGRDVVLLEKYSHPREKVGESLIPDFWKYLDKAGVTEKVEKAGFIGKAGGMVSWQGQIKVHRFKEFGYDRPAMHVDRPEFDKILFDHAAETGAKTFEFVSVSGATFDVDDEGLEHSTVSYSTEDGEGQIRCRYVIDATGQNAVLGRQMGLKEIDEVFRAFSLWGYYEGANFLDFNGKAHRFEERRDVPPVTYVSSIEESSDSGWSWHITLQEKTSVGLVIPQKHVKDARQNGETWEEFFDRRAREVPVLKDLLEPATMIPGSVATIRDYSFQSKEIAGPGWFLIGDAAGFVDPIFSVGVVMALYSAAAVAWAIDEMLKRPARATRIRDLFVTQVRGRLEVARSLALPQYRSEGAVSDLAKNAIQLERNDVKELMYAVSSLTSRTDNWDEMVGGERPETAGRLHILEELDLTV